MPQFPHRQNEFLTLLPGQVLSDECEAAVTMTVTLPFPWTPRGFLGCLLSGDSESSQLVPAEAVSFTIPKLKDNTTYAISVSAVGRGQEGNPTVLTAKTCECGIHGLG